MTGDGRVGLGERIMHFLGPGIFMIGYNIGTGSVTTMSVAGADYGMSLLWTLILACSFTGIMITAYGRFTAVTGKTGLQAMWEYVHPGIAVFILVAMCLSCLAAVIGVMGICTEATSAWIAMVFPDVPNVSMLVPGLLYSVMLYILFLRGRYQVFEKVLAIFVGLMGLCFFASMILVIPEPMEVLRGMMPAMPEGAGALLVVAGMTGTTLSPILIIARSMTVQQRGWTAKDLRAERRDAILAAVLMFVISAAIMACAAGTMHVQGIKIDSAIDMMWTLAPIAGSFAITVFVVGLVSAGLSSHMPNMIFIPWAIRDIRRKPIKGEFSLPLKLVVAGVLCVGLSVPIFGGKPVIIMIASQAFLGISMPLLAIVGLILLNRKDLMGEHTNSVALNIAIGITLAFSCWISFLGLKGLAGLL